MTIAASLIAGLIAHVVDQLLGLESLTRNWGGAGSLLRLLVLGLIMVPIIAWVMLAARVPDALAALAAVRRRLGRRPTVAAPPIAPPDRPRPGRPLTYSDQRNSFASRHRQCPAAAWRGPPAAVAGDWMRKGPAVTDDQSTGAAAGPDGTATTKIPRPTRPTTSSPMCRPTTSAMTRPSPGRQHRFLGPPTAPRRCRYPAGRPPTTAAIRPVKRCRSTSPANRRSRPPPPMRTSTSFPAPPSAAAATGCWSSTAAHPTCSSGRRSTPRWTGRSR